MREDDPALVHRGLSAAYRGHDRTGRQTGDGTGRGPRRRVSETRLDAVARRGRKRRVRFAHARRAGARAAAGGDGAAEARRPGGLRGSPDLRALRRHAAARRHRPCAGKRSRAHAHGRASGGAGRIYARIHPGIDPRCLAAHGEDVLFHHSQRRGGAVPRHASRGDDPATGTHFTRVPGRFRTPLSENARRPRSQVGSGVHPGSRRSAVGDSSS